jgi:hypothetical protein
MSQLLLPQYAQASMKINTIVCANRTLQVNYQLTQLTYAEMSLVFDDLEQALGQCTASDLVDFYACTPYESYKQYGDPSIKWVKSRLFDAINPRCL